MASLCDAHIHLLPQAIARHSTFYQGPWVDRGQLRSYLDKHEIHRALLTYPSTDADQALGGNANLVRLYNAFLDEIVREDPRIMAAGLVDVEDLAGIPTAVQDLKDRGMAAIGITSSHAGKFMVQEMRVLFESAERHNLPIFVHPQTTNPIGCERVQDPLLMPALQFPMEVSMCLGLLLTSGILTQHKVKFLFPGLGGVLPFLKERLDRVYAMLRTRNLVNDLGDQPSHILRNVYVDTAGASLPAIRMAIELFGVDNLLWGSDCPALGDVRNSLDPLLELGAVAWEKITGGNFRRLFFA